MTGGYVIAVPRPRPSTLQPRASRAPRGLDGRRLGRRRLRSLNSAGRVERHATARLMLPCGPYLLGFRYSIGLPVASRLVLPKPETLLSVEPVRSPERLKRAAVGCPVASRLTLPVQLVSFRVSLVLSPCLL